MDPFALLTIQLVAQVFTTQELDRFHGFQIQDPALGMVHWVEAGPEGVVQGTREDGGFTLDELILAVRTQIMEGWAEDPRPLQDLPQAVLRELADLFREREMVEHAWEALDVGFTAAEAPRDHGTHLRLITYDSRGDSHSRTWSVVPLPGDPHSCAELSVGIPELFAWLRQDRDRELGDDDLGSDPVDIEAWRRRLAPATLAGVRAIFAELRAASPWRADSPDTLEAWCRPEVRRAYGVYLETLTFSALAQHGDLRPCGPRGVVPTPPLSRERARLEEEHGWVWLDPQLSRWIHGLAARSGLEEQARRDLSQDVFDRMRRAQARFIARGPGSFLGYVRRIARNRVIDGTRKTSTESLELDPSARPIAVELGLQQFVPELCALLGGAGCQRAVRRLATLLSQVYGLGDDEYRELLRDWDVDPGSVQARLAQRSVPAQVVEILGSWRGSVPSQPNLTTLRSRARNELLTNTLQALHGLPHHLMFNRIRSHTPVLRAQGAALFVWRAQQVECLQVMLGREPPRTYAGVMAGLELEPRVRAALQGAWPDLDADPDQAAQELLAAARPSLMALVFEHLDALRIQRIEVETHTGGHRP